MSYAYYSLFYQDGEVCACRKSHKKDATNNKDLVSDSKPHDGGEPHLLRLPAFQFIYLALATPNQANRPHHAALQFHAPNPSPPHHQTRPSSSSRTKVKRNNPTAPAPPSEPHHQRLHHRTTDLKPRLRGIPHPQHLPNAPLDAPPPPQPHRNGSLPPLRKRLGGGPIPSIGQHTETRFRMEGPYRGDV